MCRPVCWSRDRLVIVWEPDISNPPFLRRRIKRWASASRRRTYVPYDFPQNTKQYDFHPPHGVLFKHFQALARSEANKSSSFFDLAIDNKDFDYGNHIYIPF
ncbi:uncharacterized protein [Drosophila pseudoobscura]|uniref:DUF4744 domain-containing protein n=1 Tax=Drosophila pseudoobscura pseudoobscura TaxID=46245 RepID=A0A6I8W9A9_DROPS|nr:uncharacterized protein LOC117184872 [Drosophila pseudoobscura]